MIYLYDEAITNDLIRSFNPENVADPVVKVVDPQAVFGLAAQIQNDEIKFPIVAITRDPDTPIDKDRSNFTRLHRGVQTVIDTDTNNIYYEKVIPIKLNYKLTVLTTNTVDMDEIVRELLFKYTQMYFLSIVLPYECNRKVRFGITIDPDSSIDRESGQAEYIEGGTLHQSIIPLKCEGCVLVSYTPAKLKRIEHEIETTTK